VLSVSVLASGCAAGRRASIAGAPPLPASCFRRSNEAPPPWCFRSSSFARYVYVPTLARGMTLADIEKNTLGDPISTSLGDVVVEEPCGGRGCRI
jgi:hypothetical protein